MLSVSVCIANYRQDKFLVEARASIDMQTYPGIETIVYDDLEGVGSGEAFNRAISYASGDIIILLCADDIFTCKEVVSDIVNCFDKIIELGHVSRWYHQFVDGDSHPVRAWRGENVIELANNPSGLAFRRMAIFREYCKNIESNDRRNYVHKLTNKMFVEAPFLVKEIIEQGWAYSILRYDTVAVRVHKSTARSKGYYAKMWTSSPVEEWSKLGWKTDDFTHLIQVRNYFTWNACFKEAIKFININPLNIVNISFWFFVIIALLTPRFILLNIPDIYRSTLGKWTTQVIKREE